MLFVSIVHDVVVDIDFLGGYSYSPREKTNKKNTQPSHVS
jgi:hypothetical protein